MKQEEILVKLVEGKDGQKWATNAYGWSLDGTVSACDFTGVDCEWGDHGSVTSIKLPGQNIVSSLPSEFGQLTELKELDLSGNVFFGSIPPEVAGLPKLVVFKMSNNQLSGPLPIFTSTSLKELDLEKNRLSGTIPNTLGIGLTSMTNFNLNSNHLSGTLPLSIMEMTSLQYLQLCENGLHGTLPTTLGGLSNLEFLYLNNNYFVGEIPKELTHSSSKLAEVWLQDNMLSGTVPANFATVTTLKELYVDGNKLTGTLPIDLCKEAINADFYDYNPSFYQTHGRNTRDFCESIACPKGFYSTEGIWPCEPCPDGYINPYVGRELSCFPTNSSLILQKFYKDTDGVNWIGGSNWYHDGVSVCDFHGITCDNMDQVIGIELPGMGLKGTIPEVLGFLPHLDVLDLSDNELEGIVPSDLAFAPLNRLNLTGNRLTGIVPPKLCMLGANGNGQGGLYECDSILCAEGTYSDTGIYSISGQCKTCTEGANLLGKRSCASLKSAGSFAGILWSSSASQQATTKGPSYVLIVLTLIVSVIGLVGSVYLYLQRKGKKAQIQAASQEEELSLADDSALWFSRRIL